MKNTITCMELNQWINEGREFFLLDVLPPECYDSRHIPGAKNACVYEMTFLDQVRQIIGDRNKPIVVYDSSNRSKASTCAAGKLGREGYQCVLELAGGMEEWEGSGYPVRVLGPDFDDEPVLPDGIHVIANSDSRVEWIGRNLGKRHHGTVDVKDGEISIQDGIPTSGSITMDMNTIRNSDLEDDTNRNILIRHLSSEDFFDVARFPTARFEIVQCDHMVGSTPGSPNYCLKGVLTIKDVSREISIPATFAPGENAPVRVHACLEIDRTAWNINYGSGKLFEKLGMHLVSDLISLEMFLNTR